VCCRYTTTPKCRPGVSVSIVLASSFCSWFPVVVLRVELSATRLSAEFGQPALDYHVGAYFPRSSRLNIARTFHAVGRAVLESASPGLQPGATPSQLPTHQQAIKKARCPCDTGLSAFFGVYGPVSHAQWIIGAHIRRMTGKLFSRCPSLCDT
jgi:hypothetical protein